MLNLFNIFSPSLRGQLALIVEWARLKNGGDADLQEAARGNTLQARGMELSDGRSAPRAMQTEGIAWRNVLWQRRIPGDEFRCAGKIKPRSRQRRHMQRLANMAGGIRPVRMLVQQRSARRKKEQRGAGQQRQALPHNCSSEQDSHRVHRTEIYLSTTRGGGRGPMLEKQHRGRPHT